MSEEADLEVVAQEYEDWKTAGRPDTKTHEEFMAELFSDEAAAVSAAMDEWIAAGRPGAKSHEAFMIELFGYIPE